MVYRSFERSLFSLSKERISVVVYNKYPVMYSLGLHDGIHYAFMGYPDLRVYVPGGYKEYRMGGLGKLAKIERDTSIIAKAFSDATSSFVDYVMVMPGASEVFYGGAPKDSTISLPSLWDIVKSEANMSWFDKLFFILYFRNTTPNEYQVYDTIPVKGDEKKTIVDIERFYKQIRGVLFEASLRDERKTVQLLYGTSYSAARRMARISEGVGVQINDILQSNEKQGSCVVAENTDKHSMTAQALSAYFQCNLVKDGTGVYDIVWHVGGREGEWE